MSFIRILAFSFYTFLAVAKPLKGKFAPRQEPSPTTPAPAVSTSCGDIVVFVKNDINFFPASLVHDCLQSIPFNPAVAIRFLDYYNTTLQFQSTLEYLKAPPTGYQRPPFDVEKTLSGIKQNVTAGVYRNQYEFETQLQLFISELRDTHVNLDVGALSAFTFVSPYGLVSASSDGTEAPKIYTDNDLYHEFVVGSEEFKASHITKINGVDVLEYLEQFAERNSEGFLERHADWNAIMDSPAADIQGQLSTFQAARLYPGAQINFTFADRNGTTTEPNNEWWAYCSGCNDTGPLTTGGDFYNYFVLGLQPDSYNEEDQWWPTLDFGNGTDNEDEDEGNDDLESVLKAYCNLGNPSRENWCLTSFGAYPNDPIVTQKDLAIQGEGVVSGYMLDGVDNSTAVLSIPAFFQLGDDITNFRQSILDFIGNASQANATRVIIDLQQNTGGLTFLAYDAFKMFFPNIEPYGASRKRSHELGNILGETYNGWWDLPSTDKETYYAWGASEWIATNRLNAATNRTFSSWAEYYAPRPENGDTFSAAERYDFSNQNFDYAAFGDIPWGYDPDAPLVDVVPEWSPDEIVILTDGLCASACSLFVEFMTHQAGVRTVAVGGHPSPGPMQAVSGSRGAVSYSADEIDYDFQDGLGFPVNREDVAAKLPNRTDSGMWVRYAGVTIRDQVRADDPTPLQFKYLAADCRLYYTKDNAYNLTRLWRDVAHATWDDPSLCVQSSTGYPTGRNATSEKAAPSPDSKKSGILDLEPVAFTPWTDQSAFQLTSKSVAVSNGPLTPTQCDPARPQCGSKSCRQVKLNCSGGVKSTYACLTSCEVGERSSSCSGTCKEATKLDSKSNGKSAGTNAIRYQGFCHPPMSATKSLPCPK